MHSFLSAVAGVSHDPRLIKNNAGMFSSNFLDSGTTLALAVRSIRYFIITIVIIGVYPMMFRLGDKIFKKKSS